MLQSVLGDKVGQILQVATLRLKEDRYSRSRQHAVSDNIVVGNTHLFYHPMADHVRAIQAYTVCQQLDKIRRQSKGTTMQEPPIPFILCGDLNSDPLSGAMRLLLHRQVEADHFETWKHLHSYTWNMGEQEYMVDHGYVGHDVNASSDPTFMDEAFEDAHQEPHDIIETSSKTMGLSAPPCIQLPQSISKLISGYRQIPEFTNYATDFCETLDYILASEPNDKQLIGFEALDEAAPCPTSREMKDYIAMPNEFMPSDHVSLVCDLQWKRSERILTPENT
jgi:2',5'-phosphodiesterase